MTDKGDAEGTIVIGAGVEFKGEVSVPGRATINGKFDGALRAAELIVGPSGEVNGQINVQSAEIHGKVGENLTVQSKLIIRVSGAVSGTVSYSKIMVEEGGALVGTFNVNSTGAATSANPNTGATEAKAAETNVVQLQQAE